MESKDLKFSVFFFGACSVVVVFFFLVSFSYFFVSLDYAWILELMILALSIATCKSPLVDRKLYPKWNNMLFLDTSKLVILLFYACLLDNPLVDEWAVYWEWKRVQVMNDYYKFLLYLLQTPLNLNFFFWICILYFVSWLWTPVDMTIDQSTQ